MSGVVADILEQSLGKIVVVRLKAGKILRGRLKGFDQHLNQKTLLRLKTPRSLD